MNHKNLIIKSIVTLLIITNLIVWGNRFLIKKNASDVQQYLLHPDNRDPDFKYGNITLPIFKLEINGKNSLNSEKLGATLSVLIFFSTQDCPACLFEAFYWNEAYRQFAQAGVNLVGITADSDAIRLDAFIKGYDLQFPVFHDPKGEIRTKILSLDNVYKESVKNRGTVIYFFTLC